jgi:hypothetical protein
MNINRRIKALEKVTFRESRALQVVTVEDDETREEAATRYCLENNLEEGEFITGELGTIIQVVHV